MFMQPMSTDTGRDRILEDHMSKRRAELAEYTKIESLRANLTTLKATHSVSTAIAEVAVSHPSLFYYISRLEEFQNQVRCPKCNTIKCSAQPPEQPRPQVQPEAHPQAQPRQRAQPSHSIPKTGYDTFASPVAPANTHVAVLELQKKVATLEAAVANILANNPPSATMTAADLFTLIV